MPDFWTVLLAAVLLLLFVVPVAQQQVTRARRPSVAYVPIPYREEKKR